MTKLKSYYKVHETKKAEPAKAIKRSGVACTDFVVKDGKKTTKPCPGEMMIFVPEQTHPEYPQLKRAKCGTCGWRGWV